MSQDKIDGTCTQVAHMRIAASAKSVLRDTNIDQHSKWEMPGCIALQLITAGIGVAQACNDTCC